MALIFDTVLGDLLAVGVLLAAIGALYVRRKFSYWQQRGIEFVAPSFPFGNFHSTFLQRQSFGDRTVELYEGPDGTDAAKPFVGVYTGLIPALMLRDPELIRTVLIKDFALFVDRGVYSDEKRDPLSGNLFALPADKWRHMRQKLSPTFTSGKLKAMFSTLVECGAPLQRRLGTAADGGEMLEMREIIAQFTTNVIASVAFGLDIDCIADPETAFRRFGRKVFAPTLRNSLRSVLGFFFPSWLGTLGLRGVDRDVEEFFMSVVRQNMKHRETNNVSRKDFFQLLVQLRNSGIEADGVWATKITGNEEDKHLSVEQCAAQSFVFYLAGFETSSTTVSFALYELAKNAECQRRLQREIDEVLARHEGAITYESVGEMKYLDWCIDETLRMYPPVPILNRVCATTWTIPNSGGLTLEPGTPIIVPVYALQYDPKYYPNPQQFEPERFSPEKMAGKGFIEQPYLPFGEGPRNCIGLRLGKMQSKVGLIVMLQRFSYALAGNTTKPLVMNASSLLLAPVGGVNLRVTHRD